MKRNTFLTLAAVALAVVSLQLLRRPRTEGPMAPQTVDSVNAAPESVASAPQTNGPSASVIGQRSGFTLPPPQETFWNQPVAEPAFTQFADWARRYEAAATPEAKAALEAEGIALATERRQQLAELI